MINTLSLDKHPYNLLDIKLGKIFQFASDHAVDRAIDPAKTALQAPFKVDWDAAWATVKDKYTRDMGEVAALNQVLALWFPIDKGGFEHYIDKYFRGNELITAEEITGLGGHYNDHSHLHHGQITDYGPLLAVLPNGRTVGNVEVKVMNPHGPDGPPNPEGYRTQLESFVGDVKTLTPDKITWGNAVTKRARYIDVPSGDTEARFIYIRAFYINSKGEKSLSSNVLILLTM